MNDLLYRKATDADITPMAQIRDREWGTEDYGSHELVVICAAKIIRSMR